MLGQHGKSQKQQLEPSAFPSFLHAHDVNPGRFVRTTATGQVSWSSIGSDCECGRRCTTWGGGGGNVWRAGRTEAPCVVLSLLPALPGRSLLTLFAQSSCQHNWQTGYSSSWKHLSRRNQDTPLKPAKLPPASPAQHENKQLFPQIVWVDGESQNLGTEII